MLCIKFHFGSKSTDEYYYYSINSLFLHLAFIVLVVRSSTELHFDVYKFKTPHWFLFYIFSLFFPSTTTMPNLISIAKITVLAACGFGLANGSVIYQQKTVTEFGQEVWAEAQHVFHDVSQRGHETVHEGGNKVLQKSTFTTFTHPSFSEYALRYKKPSLCDPSVNQVYAKSIILPN